MIHLGYEIGTGKPVSIPLAHMAVTGQTQQSGKTTTLEALIDRSGVRAVVFVTKPGEKSFTEGRRILPYFRERADWEYVKDLLESRTGEKMGSKVGYLMRVCAGAKSLEEVRFNITKELKKKKTRSSRPDTHEVLAGYIDLILGEFEKVIYTNRLELATGVNIMDLSGIADETQDMIIRSTVERVHKHERNTVIVVPEAWKIIPEGGRSLVFEALHRLIREGATNGNFVWIDAQDLAIVNKRILKSVSVWILGKQQEANEVLRTIRHLIAPVNIEPDRIKSLGIGEFLACFDSSTRRVYVQPRWLGELDAIAIAKREETVATAAQVFREKKRRGEIRGIRPAPRQLQILDQTPPPETGAMASTGDETDEQKETSQSNDSSADGQNPQRGSGHVAFHSGSNTLTAICNSDAGDDEAMWKEKFEALETEYKVLIQAHDALAAEVRCLRKETHTLTRVIPNEVDSPPASTNGETAIAAYPSMDFIYAQIRERALADKDPAILRLLTTRPELRVQIEPKVLELDETTSRGQVAKLIHEKFFDEPRNGNAVCSELLERRRFKGARVSVYEALNAIAGMGFLVRDKQKQYTATGMKVTVSTGKER